MARPAYRDPHYQADRRELLQGDPPCALRLPGCKGRANTAHHVPELQEHEHEPGSGCCRLVPACRSCNTRAGNQTRGRKTRRRNAARARAVTRQPKQPTPTKQARGSRQTTQQRTQVERTCELCSAVLPTQTAGRPRKRCTSCANKTPCPDCGGPKSRRAARCQTCHLDHTTTNPNNTGTTTNHPAKPADITGTHQTGGRTGFLDGHRPGPRTKSGQYLGKGSKSAEMLEEAGNDVRIGRDEPHLASPITGEVDSYGPDVAAWSEKVLELEPMPWQRIALDRQLSHADGQLLHRLALTSVARQNGKTIDGIEPLIGWWLTEMCRIRGQAQSVLSTSHKGRLMRKTWMRLAPVLEREFKASVVWSFGREELWLPCGCYWAATAPTDGAGHGTTNDLVTADEVWDISSACFDDGLVPTTRAVRSPLVSAWSTAGTKSSEVMLSLRQEGLRAIDAGEVGRVCLTEWSMPKRVSPMDRRYWRWSNPAMGKPQSGLTFETLVSESENPDRTKFLRPALNCWVGSEDSWLPADAWDSCEIDPLEVTGGVLTGEQSTDGDRIVGVRAVPVEGGVHVRTEFVVDDLDEWWAEAGRLRERDKQVSLAVSPALELAAPEALDGKYLTVGQAEISKWTATVKKMILRRRVTHPGGLQLGEQVSWAVAGLTQGGASLTLSSARSPGPIEMCRCMVWAVALASRPASSRKPEMAFSG